MRERFFEAGHATEKQLAQRERAEKETETIKAGEIHPETWQGLLDEALAKDDFSFIKTLQNVKPEIKPHAELASAKMRELITAEQEGWVEKCEHIRSVSDAELDETFIFEKYERLFKNIKIVNREIVFPSKLRVLKEITGYMPPEDLVHTYYKNSVTNIFRLDEQILHEECVRALKDITGIQPDEAILQHVIDTGDVQAVQKAARVLDIAVTDTVMQRVYEAQFIKNGYLDTRSILKLKEKPHPDLVARCYKRIMEKREEGWIGALYSLEHATGIQPALTEEEMRPVFKAVLLEGSYYRLGTYVIYERLVAITKIKPRADFLEEIALKIIDANMTNGDEIISYLKRLEEVAGVAAIRVSEEKIQDRYRKAMADKNAAVIPYLFYALRSRPDVDTEEARRFMVSIMDKTDVYTMEELAAVFCLTFEATDEEIAFKQNESLEKLDFYALSRIKELTGKDYDPKKLEVTLIQWFKKEALDSGGSRAWVEWEKPIRARLEEFGVVIPAEIATDIYRALIQNEKADSPNIVKTYQFTGVPIPKELVQQAYQKYIASGHIPIIATAFEELFTISGIQPEIAHDELQAFYRNALKDEFFARKNISIVAEITGIEPQFDPEDIHSLYKELLLSGRGHRLIQLKKITGVEPKLDAETTRYVEDAISGDLANVSSAPNTMLGLNRKTTFDSHRLKEDLENAAVLIEETAYTPDPIQIQAMYDSAIESSAHSLTIIKSIAETTGIPPHFTPEQLQQASEEFLQSGRVDYLRKLGEYGTLDFNPTAVEEAYQKLFHRAEKLNAHYFVDDFADSVSELQSMSGVEPSNEILAQILQHYISNVHPVYYRLDVSKMHTSLPDGITYLKKRLGTYIDEPLVQCMYVTFLQNNSLKEFVWLKDIKKIEP